MQYPLRLIACLLGLTTLIAPARAADFSSVEFGPVDQWRAKRAGFHNTLIANDHSSPCDWVRFSMLTFMSYTTAEHEGERRNWTGAQTNALRHAIWQYQLARAFDSDTAAAIGDEQERLTFDERDSAIDQHNNQVARALYEKHRAQGTTLSTALDQIVQSIDTQDGQFHTRIGGYNRPHHSPFFRLPRPCGESKSLEVDVENTLRDEKGIHERPAYNNILP